MNSFRDFLDENRDEDKIENPIKQTNVQILMLCSLLCHKILFK